MKIPASIMLAAMTILGLSSRADAVTAREIIEASEGAVRGDTQVSVYAITVKARKWTRTMELKSWEVRSRKKSFAEIYAPAKDAGNRFLLIDQNMRHYVPELQQDIKISPSMMLQAWMGSDFTNDDIVKESSITVDYDHELDGTGTVDGHECYRVVLTPRPEAAVVWGKIVYFARLSDYLPVRQEFYNEHGALKKTLSYGNFAFMGGRTIPTWYKMQTSGREDQYTVMEIRDALFNTPIPDYIFTIQNLTRR